MPGCRYLFELTFGLDREAGDLNICFAVETGVNTNLFTTRAHSKKMKVYQNSSFRLKTPFKSN